MFRLFSVDHGQVPGYEYLPAGAITPKYGLAVYFSSGVMAVAAGANKPTHICMEEHASAVSSGTTVACVKITDDQVWESVRDDNSSTVAIGTKYDVASGGLKVDVSSTSNGCFAIEYEEAKATDAIVRGRFVI